MLIFLWGLADEAPLAAVALALRDAGAEFVLLDQRKVLGTRVTMTVDKQVSGSISLGESRIDLEDIAAAYIRPYESRMLSAVRNTKSAAVVQFRAAAVDEMLLNWADITPALVLNRPRHMAVNSSKPYQSQLIRRCGFLVPETLISTTPAAAREFQERHRDVIYKSVSGVRSRVARLAAAHSERLRDIMSCPTQFQEFIPGCDFRAHVIGAEVFASELLCDADDYRYPGDHMLEIRECRLPHSIEERCIALAQSMELPVAGIDLRRTPEDEWYCFEVNPSPAFTFYQEFTGQPIAAAIAKLLIAGSASPASSQYFEPFDSTLPTGDQSPLLVPASFWME